MRVEYGTLDLRNMDCMELMKAAPDNHWDLAIVDPPYGIGESGGKNRRGKSKHKKKDWDKCSPDSIYFQELQRVSKDQVIWGANYFTENLQASMGWICWDKKLDNSDFSDFELAYSSFNRGAKIFRFSKNGGSRTPAALADIVHPTQKPVALYRWLLQNYAKDGDTILDTHLGSGSIAIACYYMGYDLTGSELDPDYYAAMMERIDKETRQQELF
jgi:site-specific DNA-methyltransferase (adenine-specific)